MQTPVSTRVPKSITPREPPGLTDDHPHVFWFRPLVTNSQLPGFGRAFPHHYGNPGDRFFTTLLTVSPAGDGMTLDFTRMLIQNEDLGDDEITDFIAASFSSTDYYLSRLDDGSHLLPDSRTRVRGQFPDDIPGVSTSAEAGEFQYWPGNGKMATAGGSK
jgi:hypothetical protein